MEHDSPQEDYAGRFLELFWELRARNLSKWERLVAEEILLRSYGSNRASVTIRRLDALAGFLGLSRGHLHDHLSGLLTGNILANDESPGKAPRTWWFKDLGLWTINRRIEPGTERAKRSEAGDVELRDDNLPPDERPLPGFEPKQTDAEVQADANLERADHGPAPRLSAAASGSASFAGPEKIRSRIGNGSRNGNEKPVPEMGTVPESGTGQQDNAPACDARPGFPEAWTEARQAGNPLAGEKARESKRWRALTGGEASLQFEMEDWFREGPDTEELIERYRESWQGRIRRDSGLVRRALADVQLEIREEPDKVKVSRGGLLHTRYNEFLRQQPPKPNRAGHAPVPARPAVALVPASVSALSWEQVQAQVAEEKAKFILQINGGRS